MKSNTLIVIRGPSCSGKSTLAKRLISVAKNKCALIQQDSYREIFKPPGGGSQHNGVVISQMIEHNTVAALQHGYNVVLEGVLNIKTYQTVLDNIVHKHQGNSLFFYLDVSLQETIQRGKTKPNSALFNATQLTDWYAASIEPYRDIELRLSQELSAEQAFEQIIHSIDVEL